MKDKALRNCGIIVLVLAAMIFAAGYAMPGAHAEDNGIPDGYIPSTWNSMPHVQMKDLFTNETVEIKGIRVYESVEGIKTDPEGDVCFRIYNTTIQQDEFGELVRTVKGEDGGTYLPLMYLRKDHDYIFFAEDPVYHYPEKESYPSANKPYVMILSGSERAATDGDGAYNYLKNSIVDGSELPVYKEKLKEIVVEKRDNICTDPYDDNRYDTSNDEVFTYYKSKKMPGVSLKLVSDLETIHTSTDESGRLVTKLIEGVTYMVYADGGQYANDPFPIVAKDKTEYGDGLFCYDHRTCIRVASKAIQLYDSLDDAYSDWGMGGDPVFTCTSLKDRSVVTGMNFKDLIFIDRILGDTIDALEGKTYETISFTAVNPRRWEISKLCGTDFRITWKGAADRIASHVYYLKDGSLKEIGFTQKNKDEVTFIMDSLSVYPVVIEYDSGQTYSARQAQLAEEARKAEAARLEKERKAKEAAWNGKRDAKMPALKSVKVTAGKKKATVKWKKLTAKQLKKAGNIKIEVQYSLYKKFPMEYTKSKYTTKKKTSLTIKSLKSGKTYYYRVRTVKTVGKVKHVSAWSKTLKKKIK